MLYYQNKESVLLIDSEWVKLRYSYIQSGSCSVFIAKLNEFDKKKFIENIDYEINYSEGKIRRRIESSISSFSNSKFFNLDVFNHEDYNGNFGNYEFMVYVSYNYNGDDNVSTSEFASRITLQGNAKKLIKTKEKLRNSQDIKYVVYGDSISTGQEALLEDEAYFNRFVAHMRKISESKIEMINKSIGGETSRQGIARFDTDVISQTPDLVSIGYGINDMCIKNGSADITLVEFKSNISSMVEKALESGAEVLLITSCLPNPKWIYSNPDVRDYSQILREVAKSYDVSLADVQTMWENEISQGKTISSLLLNDINHPTSYGHYLYYSVIEKLLE